MIDVADRNGEMIDGGSGEYLRETVDKPTRIAERIGAVENAARESEINSPKAIVAVVGTVDQDVVFERARGIRGCRIVFLAVQQLECPAGDHVDHRGRAPSFAARLQDRAERPIQAMQIV